MAKDDALPVVKTSHEQSEVYGPLTLAALRACSVYGKLTADQKQLLESKLPQGINASPNAFRVVLQCTQDDAGATICRRAHLGKLTTGPHGRQDLSIDTTVDIEHGMVRAADEWTLALNSATSTPSQAEADRFAIATALSASRYRFGKELNGTITVAEFRNTDSYMKLDGQVKSEVDAQLPKDASDPGSPLRIIVVPPDQAGQQQRIVIGRLHKLAKGESGMEVIGSVSIQSPAPPTTQPAHHQTSSASRADQQALALTGTAIDNPAAELSYLRPPISPTLPTGPRGNMRG
jgi:hypothetical protein